jgi:hypothetical protein
MFRSIQKVLLGKIESAYGSDPTPVVGTDAIDARGIKVTYKGDLEEREMQRASISQVSPKVGQRWVELSFAVEVKGSGTRGTAGQIGKLLQAAGWSEVATAGSSVVYSPASTGHKSLTFYIYDIQVETGNSRLHKITGAKASKASLKAEAGKVALLELTFQGIDNAPTDVATPAAATLESTTPPIVESATLLLNAVATLIAQAVNLDLGITLGKREDLNSAGGIKGFDITARKVSGSVNPEAVLVATYDFHADWIAATQRALSVVIGSVAGNKVTITAPKLTLDGINEAEREGIRIDELPFHCGVTTSDDELVFKFE